MLTANISQLDQLPFLKRQKYKWPSQQQQHQKSRIRLLDNLRCLSYQSSSIMAKLFMFEKFIKKDTSGVTSNNNNEGEQQQQQQSKSQQHFYQQLIVTTQKEILPLEKYYYLLNDILPQQQFSPIVGEINLYINKCKQYIKDQLLSRFQVDFGNREFLAFNVYMERRRKTNMQKQSNVNKKLQQNQKQQQLKTTKQDFTFTIKCTFTTMTFTPYKDITPTKHPHPPKQYTITQPIITTHLFNHYQQLLSIPLTITKKSITQYINYFDTIQHMIDQQYLKLQVFKNYPLLRCKYYLLVRFIDKITKQKLDGPIFSNANPQCMFGHFYGYNADTIKILQGNNCQQCYCSFYGVQQNPIMTYLRDNLFNPYKADVLYLPQYNRFKLVVRRERQREQQRQQRRMDINNNEKTNKKQALCNQQQEQINNQNAIIEQQQQQTQQQQQQQQKQPHPTITYPTYLNYLHLRCNLRKLTTKRRLQFNTMLQYEKFPLTFNLWGRKLLIMDPVRGRNCTHYQFTDLRMLYLNKIIDDNDHNTINKQMYKCPICNDILTDNDILYLKQVQILTKYLKYKCSKHKQSVLTASCFIDHRQSKLFIQYKKPNNQLHTTQTEILQIKNFYHTLIDPYVSFNQYSLGIPDKYQQKMRSKYLFGFDQQNQQNNNDDGQDDFQYLPFTAGNYGNQEYQSQKLSKKIQKISVQNKDSQQQINYRQ